MAPPRKHISNEEGALNVRTRENIKVVKVLRGLSDEDIARLGKFTSRQVVADRVNGRTVLSLLDVERIADALGVSFDALVGPRSGLMAWMEENPTAIPQEATLPPMRGRTSLAAKKAAPRKTTRKRH